MGMHETAIEQAIADLKDRTGQAIEKYEGQVKDYATATNEARAEVKALTEQFAEMQAQLLDVAQKQVGAFHSAQPILTPGQEFIQSEAFKNLASGNSSKARVEVKKHFIEWKNTVTSTANTTFPQQMPGIIPGDFAPTTIRSLFRVIPVSTNVVSSLREASWTNSAAMVSEGTAKPESDITFEQVDVNIKTVAHWIKVTNQLLADAPAVVAYIEDRARDGLAQRVDAQLLNGNGTSPNLSGLTDSGNFTAYTATTDDLLTDAINRARYSLWAIGHQPTVCIVNPADWGAMERTKETGGAYLYGAPGSLAGNNPFGVRIVLSNNMASGNFWIGNIDTCAVLYARSGAVVEMGYVNDDFTKNLVTIRVEERLGLGIERPTAALYGAFTA